MSEIVLCSACFADEGLILSAQTIGIEDSSACPNCGATASKKLDIEHAKQLAHQFYTWGSLRRGDYGGAPQIVSNDRQKTTVSFPKWAGSDAVLLSDKLGIGFFLYGPRLWMLGEVTPLKQLEDNTQRESLLKRIVSEYPPKYIDENDHIYRVRRSPQSEMDEGQYDSPPDGFGCGGRLESSTLPILYASKDLQTCIHECRLTVQDEAFVATLQPTSSLKLLDLTHILREEGVDEFESLDLAVHMLFLAGSHSYSITRDLARKVKESGFDGLLYPSFFSLVRTGAFPFATIYGMSVRKFKELEELAKGQIVPNIALFGHPVREAKVRVRCINRLILAAVDYRVVLGPVGFEHDPK